MGQGTISGELDSGFRYFQEHNPDLFENNYDGTKEVWDKITATQENYPNTILPKSFNVETDAGFYHVNPNGTKHIRELLTSNKLLPRIKDTNPKLYTQFLLHNFQHALNSALMQGVKKDEFVIVEGWELKFGQRPKDKYPVVFHAQYRGEK
ncbi:MAG: hypothetical protein K6B43_03075 [Treponema sp.]|nr:hypothetical protein [Treponema sp.]